MRFIRIEQMQKQDSRIAKRQWRKQKDAYPVNGQEGENRNMQSDIKCKEAEDKQTNV